MVVSLTKDCFRRSRLTEIIVSLSELTMWFHKVTTMPTGQFQRTYPCFGIHVFGICYTFYLEKLFVINKHEMTITSQKYTFDPGLRYEVQQT